MLMSFWHSIHQIMQISQWKLCLGQINMEGKRNDSREDFNHKFGIKMISFINEVSMYPARRTFSGKSICPASVNHVSYRVISRFSSVVDDGA